MTTNCFSRLTSFILSFNFQPEPFQKCGTYSKEMIPGYPICLKRHHCWNTSGKSDGSANHSLSDSGVMFH